MSASLLAILLMAGLLAALPLSGGLAAAAEEEDGDQLTVTAADGSGADGGESSAIPPYFTYLDRYSGVARGPEGEPVRGVDYVEESDSGVRRESYNGRDDVLVWDSAEGSVTWEVHAPQTGLYALEITYAGVKHKGSRIEFGLYVDGALPFEDSRNIALTRLFVDDPDSYNEDGTVKADKRGNQLRPKQIEQFDWQTALLKNHTGKYDDPYLYYLEEGTHRITMVMETEALAIDSLRLTRFEGAVSYDDYLAATAAAGARDTSGHTARFEAEKTVIKNESILYPTEDRSSAANSPSHYYLVKMNTLGKSTFKYNGQKVTWEITVPADGYYYISMRARQNTTRGLSSARRMYLDGEVLFEDLNNVRFPYSTSWETHSIGNGEEPYKIYLTGGTDANGDAIKHLLTLEVVSGDMAEPLRQVDEIVRELGVWYRKIVMITGSNADKNRVTVDLNRDFQLDQRIPGLIDGFRDIVERLTKLQEYVVSTNEGNVSSAASVSEILDLLQDFIKKPGIIARRLDYFNGNISSLATWILDMREQPLEIDYFTVHSPDVKAPKSSAGFFSQVAFRFQMFISSFVEDYSSVGEIYEGQTLNVWVSTTDLTANANTGIYSGRDQAQIIKSMVDDLFVPESGIPVNLSLVNSSSILVQATLAGKGPDVALFVNRDTPVNLAMRGALVDLSKQPGWDEAIQAFYESALIPYKYQDGYYALPETQSYDMFFYRTDIFEELGIRVPDTWDDFYGILPVLQRQNMNVGINENQVNFESLIYQRGGTFYNDDLSATAFDTTEVIEAFKQWTGLYAEYSLPLVFDFFNRFRTGEMPCGIVGYTNYNYLNAAAPEITNLWAMAPIPGMLKDGYTQADLNAARDNGEEYSHMINRAETCQSTGAIIIKASEMVDEGFEFIRWWTGAEAQAQFGNELEQLMGPAARYPTANRDAFDQLPWGNTEANSLKEQWEQVTSIPQVPGNYFINRNVLFAFRKVVYGYTNERETLYKYNKEINKEIQRKREEFGLA